MWACSFLVRTLYIHGRNLRDAHGTVREDEISANLLCLFVILYLLFLRMFAFEAALERKLGFH
jgi:hypothetical protein